jgi:mRNA interferase HicA
MKRVKLLQHLQRLGCVLKREGGSHSLWRNPQTNEMQAIPRHSGAKRRSRSKDLPKTVVAGALTIPEDLRNPWLI